ncbi:MAG: hypothetical protein AAF483_00435 [Planctomycetota bacterium]
MNELLSIIRENPVAWIAAQVSLIFAIALLIATLGRSGAERHAILRIGIYAGVFVPIIALVCLTANLEFRVPVLSSTFPVIQEET